MTGGLLLTFRLASGELCTMAEFCMRGKFNIACSRGTHASSSRERTAKALIAGSPRKNSQRFPCLLVCADTHTNANVIETPHLTLNPELRHH